MRDRLAHYYFNTSHAIFDQTAGSNLAEPTAAVTSLLAVLNAQG